MKRFLLFCSVLAEFLPVLLILIVGGACFAVTLPTLSLFGVPDPLAIPAARLRRIEAGGVLVMKVNDLSL